MEENKGISNKPNPTIPVKPALPETRVVQEVLQKFPREFSDIVYIRRKKTESLPTTGEFLDESVAKIGSSLKGNSPLRGLNFEEEKKYLPQIIGISNNSPDWEKATKDYWDNISKNVPTSDKEGNGGLKLEIGLRYDTIEDYEKDQKSIKTWGELEIGNGKQKIAIENPKGTPINIADYILWRFCLVHSKVANSLEEVGKSPKIEFYIYSKQKEIKEQKVTFENKRKASQLLYTNLGDRLWVEHMLRLLIQNDKSPSVSIREVSSITEDEKDILLESYMHKVPIIFSAFAEDKNLEMKSFIEICIASGFLVRIPNTNSISFEGETIGNTIEETVTYLNNTSNSGVLGQLRAHVNVKPS